MKKKLFIVGILLSFCMSGCNVKVPDQLISKNTEATKQDASSIKPELADSKDDEENNAEETKEKAVEDTKETKNDANQEEDPFANEKGEQSESVYGSPTNIYLDGYHFVVPNDYACMFDDTIGVVVYLNNIFQMKLGVRENSFDGLLNDMPSTTSKAIEAGAEILQEPKQMDINGISYIYYVVKLEDEVLVAVLSDTPDHKGHLGCQFAVLSSDVNYEDLVHVYASINESAEPTDEPNSTADEINSQQKIISGQKKDSSSIKLENQTINFLVPEGFYSIGQSDEMDTEFFECATYNVTVTMQNTEMGDAKYLAEVYMDMNEDYNCKMTTVDYNGKTIYIVTSEYEYDGSQFHHVDCFCDYNKGYIYQVSAHNCDNKSPKIEEFNQFFELK